MSWLKDKIVYLLLSVISILLAVNSYFFVEIHTKYRNALYLQSFKDKVNSQYFYFFILFIFFVTIVLFFLQQKGLKKMFIASLIFLLPFVVIIFYGTENSSKIHWLFYLLTNGYLLTLLGYGIFLLLKTASHSPLKVVQSEMDRKSEEPRWLVLLVLISVISINLSFGFYHLGKSAVVDEPLWTMERIPKFWKNISDQDWNRVKASDKPGNTIAIVSGIGLLQIDASQFNESNKWKYSLSGSPEVVEKFNFAFRWPVLIFNALSLIFIYLLLRKLFSQSVALFGITTVGLSPIILGISIIVNPDSLLWIFSTLTILSYLILLRSNRLKFAILTGILLALAILTKYVANVLFVFFFGLIFVDFMVRKEAYSSLGWSKYFIARIKEYGLITLVALLTYFILLPAAWVEVSELAKATILSQAFVKVWFIFLALIALLLAEAAWLKGKFMSQFLNFISRKDILAKSIIALFVLLILAPMINTYLGMRPFDLETIIASPKSSYRTSGIIGSTLANFYSLIFGLNPIVLISILSFSLLAILKKNASRYFPEYLYLIIFVLLYYTGSIVDRVIAVVRYQIMVYPIALLLSAIALDYFYGLAKWRKYLVPAIPFFALIGILSFSLYTIKPHYFNYASDLLPKQYVLNLKDMGDGSYEAASFLNNLPASRDLSIWTDKNGVCFFFVGNCLSNTELKNYGETKFDYFVISSGRESRVSRFTVGKKDENYKLDRLYEMKNTEFELLFGGRPNNFVKIINGKYFYNQ